MTAQDVTDALTGLLQTRLDPDRVRDAENSWSEGLWSELVGLGMTSIDVPEVAGGGGGELEESLAVVRLCGYYNANLPIVEAGFVGSWLRGLADLPPAAGLDSVALGESRTVQVTGHGSQVRVSGDLELGWGRYAENWIILRERGSGTQLMVIGADDAGTTSECSYGRNLGGEPRDRVTLTETPCETVRDLPVTMLQVEARRGLGKAALMLGALEKVTELAIEYVRAREQFGRPLAKFQVIQHYIATMVAQLATVRAAVDLAVQSASPEGAVSVESAAAAKIRAGAAGDIIARLGHQVHGAIGVTDEHELGLSTRRIWAWRDEDGDERFWARLLGRELASRAHSPGLWPVLEPIN